MIEEMYRRSRLLSYARAVAEEVRRTSSGVPALGCAIIEVSHACLVHSLVERTPITDSSWLHEENWF